MILSAAMKVKKDPATTEPRKKLIKLAFLIKNMKKKRS